MGWIKRNLLFVVIGAVALGALGAAGYFIYRGYSSNAEKSQQLIDVYAQLKQLADTQPQPGNDKIDNTQIAKEQDQRLRAWINQGSARFHPIAPIPEGEVTSKTFASALGSTIYRMQQEAKDNSVELPPQYYFSFQVQNGMLTISSGLGPLAQQLGEVKAIAEVLFAAGVNNLDSIERVRASDDDVTKGLQGDYTDKTPITNDMAVITPYMVTFRSFTPELAKVMAAFATSTNPFIVKSVAVQPAATEGGADTATGIGGNPYYPYGPGNAGMGRYYQRGMGRPGMPGAPGIPGEPPPPSGGMVSSKGGLQTVLKEKLLRITVEVDVVKLLSKS